MLFSFRYKLSLIIFLVALLILFMAFFAIESVIEKEFRLVIEQRLQQAQDVVNQRMEDRFDRLLMQAVTVADNKLTKDILTDKNLSKVTRDDIAHDEIMPTLLADSMLITDGDGKLLAETFEHDPLWEKIKAQPSFENGIAGEEVAGIIFFEGTLLQWLLLPVYIDHLMFGTVILVSALGPQELQTISQLTGTELLISSDNEFLATGWKNQKAVKGVRSRSSKDQISFNDLEKNTQAGLYNGQSTTEVNLLGERYLLRFNAPENAFTPAYVVAQSLDHALAFVETIKQVMLIIGLIALVIAAGLGFVIACTVSRPIRLLSKANRAVAKEDFSQRVDIQTRDEFHELGESFNHMTESLAEKAKIRLALDKTVSREVADHLMQQGVQLGGERREVTILFADINGFTSLSERLSEQQLLNLLNSYFTRINSCIPQYNGTIDKYIGDAVMVLFGAPVNDALHAFHAIQAAHAIWDTVQKFNEEVSEQFGCKLDIGIGINSGQVLSGLMGSEDRMSYTVLGDHVNIASRVEGLSKLYGARIIITDETRKLAIQQAGRDYTYVYRRLDNVQVKGKTVGINIYQPVLERDEVDKKLQAYNKAYDFILKHEFRKAMAEFENYNKSWPHDKVVNLWFERCKLYAEKKEAFELDYRDGVRILNSK